MTKTKLLLLADIPKHQIEEEQCPWGPWRHVSWPDSSTSWSWGASLMSCTPFPPL